MSPCQHAFAPPRVLTILSPPIAMALYRNESLSKSSEYESFRSSVALKKVAVDDKHPDKVLVGKKMMALEG